MRNRMYEAREASGHAVWGSGTINVDLVKGHELKIHEKHPEAPPSPIYASLRPDGVKDGKLLPEHFDAIGYAMALMALEAGLFKQGTMTWVAGIPAAGEPIFDGIRRNIGPRRNQRILEFKLEKGENADGRFIAGIHPDYAGVLPCDPTDEHVLIDDLMSNLATKNEAINVVENHGAKVSHLLLFLDRSIGGIEKLTQAGVTTLAVWDYDGLLEFGLAHGYLNRRSFEAIIQYPTELQKYIDSQT